MLDLTDSFAAWWAGVTSKDRFAFSVVFGARKSGKSEYFRSLADADPSVVVWHVLSSARRTDTALVWSDLFEVLGIEGSPDDDPVWQLQQHVRDTGDRTLVVDDWDAAIDHRHGGTVNDACYEVLDEIWRFCDRQKSRPTEHPSLGLVLITSLPSTDDLEHFTRAVGRPMFERLSGRVNRQMNKERFPFITPTDAGALLRSKGVPPEDLASLVDGCGGWLWLLLEAADCYHAAFGTGDEFELRLSARVYTLLTEAVLPAVEARPEVLASSRHGMGYVSRSLYDSKDPSLFGLPSSPDDPRRAATFIRAALVQWYVVVDIENIRVPLDRHARSDPDAYPDGVTAPLQQHLGRWIATLMGQFDVHPDNVWLAGRNTHLIDLTVGPHTPGQRIALPQALNAKAKAKGSADDTLLGMYVARETERFPFARYVIITGDKDVPFLLQKMGVLDRVLIWAPWAAPPTVKAIETETAGVREFGLRMKKPPETAGDSGRQGRSRSAS